MKKIVRYILILCFLFLSITSSVSANTNFDKIEILQFLKNDDFGKLENIFAKYQERYEKDVSNEEDVYNSFNVFENSDPELEQHLNKWVLAKPDSYFSHMALGVYHYNLGWLSRGYKFADNTTSKQFAKMEAYFRKAEDEFKETIKLNPKMSIAYGYLIGIAGGNKVVSRQVLDEALSHNPLSKIVRLYYINFLEPKWGGSLQDIENYIAETKPFYSQNISLKDIEGRLPYAKGDGLFISSGKDNVKLAISYFDDAVLKSSRDNAILFSRAEANRYIGAYQKALDDCNEILSRKPQDVDALTLRGRIYIDLEDYNRALEDLNVAIYFDKFNPKALRNKGVALYKLKRQEESLQPFIDSLTYGYDSSLAHVYLGYIYYYTKKNYTLATKELKTAIELGDENPKLWYFITASQWHDRDCDFVKSANKYKETCMFQNKCDQKKLDWAIKSANYAIKKGICKN